MIASSLLVAADTMLVRQVSPDRTGFEQLIFLAAGVSQVVTLVVVVLLTVIFFRMWKAQQAMQEQLGRLGAKVDPMIASATAAAENVRALTDVVRKDAVLAADALSEATGRVRDSVGAIADRIDEFSALLGRVHAKADAVADVAGAAIDVLQLGATAMRPTRDLAADAPVDAAPRRRVPPDEARRAAAVEVDEPIRLDDSADEDSPYAAEGGPASAPRRRRRRRRGGGGSGGGQPPR